MLNRPQRLFRESPLGSLFKREPGNPIARIKLRDMEEHNPVYLGRVRQMPCLDCALEPCGQAAHVRRQSGVHNKRGGMGKKPADKWALPLCHEHHMRQHQVGELAYWYALGIEPLFVCEKLYAARGDLNSMRAVCLLAIAERKPGV